MAFPLTQCYQYLEHIILSQKTQLWVEKIKDVLSDILTVIEKDQETIHFTHSDIYARLWVTVEEDPVYFYLFHREVVKKVSQKIIDAL